MFSKLTFALTLLCISGVTFAAEPAAKQTYDLTYRPLVGLRIAYEQTMDSEVRALASANAARVSANTEQKFHRQTIVLSEEITALRNGEPVAKRMSFGPNCWYAKKEDNKPTQKVKLAFSNKTVNLSVGPDGAVQQDFGVKPTGIAAKMIRASMSSGAGLLPNRAVAIGERWRGDEGLRPMLELTSMDNVSAIMTLKGVRTQQGREVADIGCSAGILAKMFGINMEISMEGTLIVDVQTGVMLGCHLVGTSTMAASAGKNVSVTGGGKLELHQNGRFMTDETTAAAPTDATE